MDNKKTARDFKNSKTKLLDTKQLPENTNHNKSLDFLNLYKSESETSAILARSKKNISLISESTNSAPYAQARPGKVLKKNKKNEALELSQITIDGVSLNPAGMTSTPNAFKGKPSVKSIMKNTSAVLDDTLEQDQRETPSAGYRKKRNKSVSFRLEEEQASLVKKSKSEETVDTPKGKFKNKTQKKDAISQYEQVENVKKERSKPRKQKKSKEEEKENNVDNNVMEVSSSETLKPASEDVGIKIVAQDSTSNIPAADKIEKPHKEKKKRVKKPRKDSKSDITENDGNNNDKPSENKETKPKKKKRQLKQNESTQVAENVDTNGEPKTKNRKKEVKPEIIANDLENLKIGDNPHTLTNLLDDMTVVDKNKKKNSKNKAKKGKVGKKSEALPTENGDLEKIEEGKEKVVWKKRKWNKDKKSDIVGEGLLTSVVVENLPVKIMPEYRKVLTEHFSKLGLIKTIGPAEVITNEDDFFTTTIMFYSEGAATEALQQTNMELEGSTIRIKRPLPPTETTIVIRSYGALTEPALNAAFAGAGRIRSIKRLIKGKKSMATAFVEFDGSEAVEKALKMAEEARVGGKKIYVSRYDLRRGKKAGKPQADKPASKTPPGGKPQSAGDGTPVAKDEDSTSDSSDED